MTIHVGEEGGEYGIAQIREVVSTLRPDRIGHGILAARDKRTYLRDEFELLLRTSVLDESHWAMRAGAGTNELRTAATPVTDGVEPRNTPFG